MTRPSPTQSATGVGVGQNRRGNDGLMYTVTETRSGQRRWVLSEASRQARSEMNVCHAFHLRPTFVCREPNPQQQRYPEAIQPGQRHAAARRELSLDFGSRRALAVVWKSLGSVSPDRGVAHNVRSLRWDPSTGVYEALVCCASATAMRETAERVADQYGELGEDTWMEGDISVNRQYDLHLSLKG